MDLLKIIKQQFWTEKELSYYFTTQFLLVQVVYDVGPEIFVQLFALMVGELSKHPVEDGTNACFTTRN